MNEEKRGNLRDMVENYASLGRKGLRYWKRGALLGLVVLALGMLWVVKKPRSYKSEASAAIQDLAQNGTGETLPPDVAQVELKSRLDQVYGSRANLGRVVDELHLYPWLAGKTSRMKIIEAFQDGVTFTAAGRDAFHLEFVYQDPAVAQHVVQRLLQLYTEERREAGQSQSRNDLASVNTALAGLESVLSDQEDRLERFERANHEMVEQVRLRRLGQMQARLGLGVGVGPAATLAAGLPAAVGEPGDSSATRRLRIRLAGLQGRYSALQRQADAPSAPAPRPVASTPVEESERIQTLRHNLSDLRERLSRLRTTYTDQYPDVQITMRRVADAERELAAAVAAERGRSSGSSAAVATAARNPEQVRAELDAIQHEIERTRAQLSDAVRADRDNPHPATATATAAAGATATASATHGGGPREPGAATSAATPEPPSAATPNAPTAARSDDSDRPYGSLVEVESAWDRLTTELTTSRTRYQTLLTRKFELQATLDTVNTQGADVLRIIDPPTLPVEPEPPGRTRMALMIAVLSAALALGVAGLSGYLDSRLYEPADLRRWGELPELPVIPDLHATPAGTPSIAPAPAASGSAGRGRGRT